MLAEAERQTPETRARALRRRRTARCVRRGYTAVGEFHYLGFDEALRRRRGGRGGGDRARAPARGVRHAAGCARMRQESAGGVSAPGRGAARATASRVGLAPHSVRACPRDWLEEIGRYAAAERLPLHIHADEQPREIEECIAEHGCRPIELLERTGCLGPHVTVVHATHADGAELDLLARERHDASARARRPRPTSRDGFLPAARIEHRGIALCIGSDSNVRIDPLEELRELEGIARRQTGQARRLLARSGCSASAPTRAAARSGSSRGRRSRSTSGTTSLRGVDAADVFDALVSSCAADVVVSR